jgi:hypothetical protein
MITIDKMIHSDLRRLFDEASTPKLARQASDRAALDGEFTIAAALTEHGHSLSARRVGNTKMQAHHTGNRDRILSRIHLKLFDA